ncbi:MAG: RnfABCDGE type electron transport complex subunit G [Clostridia bacterium]|nr:RnfABCDGE type electron transport complex subunit G [Clostridia bacterium]
MAKVKEILKNAVVLFLITAVVSALLAGANLLTKDKIAQNSALAEQKALAEVIEADGFEVAEQIALYELQEPITGAYFAKSNSEIVGCCVKVEPSGYGGAMELIFGVDTNLAITGVSVLSHGETAGLGANITKEEFRNQFKGKTAVVGAAKSAQKADEIQALSGATISSKAIARGADTALAAAKWLMQTPGLNAEMEAVK